MTDPDSLTLLIVATVLFTIGFATSIIPAIAPFSIPAMIVILVVTYVRMQKKAWVNRKYHA